METYKNVGGGSGISAYEIGHDFIKVQFKDGSVYLYNNSSAGAQNIAEMKRLAASGQGLNGFINTRVRKNYASKLR